MAIVIKKRITLEKLGEEYKDSYLTFQSIPFKDYEKIAKLQVEIAGKDETAQGLKSLNFIQEELTKRFIEGNIDNQEVKVEDLFELPGEVIVDCFQQLMGKINPN
tara:strand:- start:1046 stop:1360 length:315 start_codon:yes stop_codon:yes gene_type:complete